MKLFLLSVTLITLAVPSALRADDSSAEYCRKVTNRTLTKLSTERLWPAVKFDITYPLPVYYEFFSKGFAKHYGSVEINVHERLVAKYESSFRCKVTIDRLNLIYEGTALGQNGFSKDNTTVYIQFNGLVWDFKVNGSLSSPSKSLEKLTISKIGDLKTLGKYGILEEYIRAFQDELQHVTRFKFRDPDFRSLVEKVLGTTVRPTLKIA